VLPLLVRNRPEVLTQMMTDPNHEIWILDDSPSVQTYGQVIGIQFKLIRLGGLSDITKRLSGSNPHKCILLIVDPSGFETEFEMQIQSLKKASIPIPEFIVASGDDTVDGMRQMMGLGAVDYLIKPLRVGELAVRCENAISKVLGKRIEILPNTIDGITIPALTFKERQLLTVFILSPDRVLKRAELFGTIWSNVAVNPKTLDVHLFNLRRKLEPSGFEIICDGQLYFLRKA
jgi:DNA-binding response OmpR family regulator